MSQWLLLFAAGMLAGAVNALAGGGTFFSFPALLAAGLPPVTANATNTVALWPASLSTAWSYRHELSRYRRALTALSVVTFVGAMAGSALLLATPNAAFRQLIPWLLLAATLLFALAPYLNRMAVAFAARATSCDTAKPRVSVSDSPAPPPPINTTSPSSTHPPSLAKAATLLQFPVAVYGGFFGAGMGIVMLAALSLFGVRDLHELQALKNWLSAIIYTVAAGVFLFAGAVSLAHFVVLTLAASLGGVLAAKISRRLPVVWLRRGILFVGTALTCYYFVSVYVGKP